MSEAEKKWAFYLLPKSLDGKGDYVTNAQAQDLAISGILTYKQALRSAIEKRIAELREHLDRLIESGDEDEAVRISSKIAELTITLDLLDSVNPSNNG